MLLGEQDGAVIAPAGSVGIAPDRLDFAAVQPLQRHFDGLFIAEWFDIGEQLEGAPVADHDLVAQPFDQRPGIGGRNRRHPVHPVG